MGARSSTQELGLYGFSTLQDWGVDNKVEYFSKYYEDYHQR